LSKLKCETARDWCGLLIKRDYLWRVRNMIRTVSAGLLGLLLLIIESMIVMKIKGYHTIEYSGIADFITIWAMNFFLVFSIMTQLLKWYETKLNYKKRREGNI
jgi:hypothetical protein